MGLILSMSLFMQVFIMRHGEAENFAPSDAERALTTKGEQQTIAMAEWLSSQLTNDIDYVLVSPYLRAQQTWQAIEKTLPINAHVETCEEITPYGHSDDVAEYLKALISTKSLKSVLVVSHLPLVGYLTAELVPGLTAPMFFTSGINCIEFETDLEQGRLLWHRSPANL